MKRLSAQHGLGLSPHYSCGNCRRGHCSPLQWIGLAAGGELTGCLVKVDFFAINDARQLSLLVFVPGIEGFNALFLSTASYCYYFRFWNSLGLQLSDHRFPDSVVGSSDPGS